MIIKPTDNAIDTTPVAENFQWTNYTVSKWGLNVEEFVVNVEGHEELKLSLLSLFGHSVLLNERLTCKNEVKSISSSLDTRNFFFIQSIGEFSTKIITAIPNVIHHVEQLYYLE